MGRQEARSSVLDGMQGRTRTADQLALDNVGRHPDEECRRTGLIHEHPRRCSTPVEVEVAVDEVRSYVGQATGRVRLGPWQSMEVRLPDC